MSFAEYAKAVKIDKAVMRTRLKKKIAIDASTGPKPVLDKGQEQVLVDTVRRYDRSNNPRPVAKHVSLAQQLNPKLTRKQASNAFAKIQRKHKDVLTGL